MAIWDHHCIHLVQIIRQTNAQSFHITETSDLLPLTFKALTPKKHSFWNFLDSSNPDIICGNETWLKPSICNSEILPDESDYEILPDESDYEIFRKDRKDGFGGVMLAIKSNINSNPIDITTVTDCDCEIIARKIECDSNKSLIVISAYRLPNSSIELL